LISIVRILARGPKDSSECSDSSEECNNQHPGKGTKGPKSSGVTKAHSGGVSRVCLNLPHKVNIRLLFLDFENTCHTSSK